MKVLSNENFKDSKGRQFKIIICSKKKFFIKGQTYTSSVLFYSFLKPG